MIKGKTEDAQPSGKTQESIQRETHRLGKTTSAEGPAQDTSDVNRWEKPERSKR